jgi:hypothetical protein
MCEAAVSNDEFTAFWNDILVDKFEGFRKVYMQFSSWAITARKPAA